MQTSTTNQEKDLFLEKSEETSLGQSQPSKPRLSKVNLDEIKPQGEAPAKGEPKVEDWIVPAQEDKSTSSRLDHYCLKFDDLNYDQENLLHVVYYIFKGHFDLIVSVNSGNSNHGTPDTHVEKV